MKKAEQTSPKQEEKSDVALREERVLTFWQENNIFEKSVEREAPNGEFVFYDGPPFATGLPHYGHLLAGTIKDVIPRYKTMQGYRVPRRWGWDCHGLPIENLIEKELGLSTKADIEKIGIDTFNEAARANVLRYDSEWKKVVPRTGRWVDMDNAYVSMDSKYTESVWWVFSELYRKNLVVEGFKPMHLCPRCETTLANFEVNQGYMDVKDMSVTAKLTLVDDPNTHMLAWTTTPWTLPGNMAAAVGPEIVYIKAALSDPDHAGQTYVLAKERADHVLGEGKYEIVSEMSGAELVGTKYLPPFPYYLDQDIDNKDNAWQVYGADYVTTDDGTGLVHLAPAFGAEDLELAQQHKIPIVHHVTKSGQFVEAVADFSGMKIKQKDDHMTADIEIVKWLAHNGKLFAKEKITHSYPHCWRCDTPLLNYATSSWFIDVPSIKDKLLTNNNNVGWVPEHIQQGRFGKWLEGAREWAVSRSRYWGAVLPVWKSADGEETHVIDSFAKLREHTKKSGNKYFFIRHGESRGNLENFLSSDRNLDNGLTEKGHQQAVDAAEDIKAIGEIDHVFVSPLQRAQETAAVIQQQVGFDSVIMETEERIAEFSFGDYEMAKYEDFVAIRDGELHFGKPSPGGGESYRDMTIRVADFMYEIEEKYQNKTILIVAHGGIMEALNTLVNGYNDEEAWEHFPEGWAPNATLMPIHFVPLPHNARYELDVHRPYIDRLPMVSPGGTELKLIGEVFDVWFESGSMPYGQLHYPFENKELFEASRFPANFIAEGLDQTRGWFYVLMVLGTALFDKSPFENVIVNGMVLAEDGKKMSKRLKNYPEVSLVFNKYGADALRLYLMASPLVRGEEVNLTEKKIAEVGSKVMGRLRNVTALYELYRENASVNPVESPSVLDQWILARLGVLAAEMTKHLNNYEIDRATRPIFDFVDDLSTWYARRSRDRFKVSDGQDKQYALATTRYVLQEFSKLIAPVTPFVAEEIYQQVKDDNGAESVHLAVWPRVFEAPDVNVLETMQQVRDLISQGLELRASAKIKVRQPLGKFTVHDPAFAKLDGQYIEFVQAEMNVKEVVFSDKTADPELDTTITPELAAEGNARELIRQIQSLRKKAGLQPGEMVTLNVYTDTDGKKLVEQFGDDISSVAQVTVVYVDETQDHEVTAGQMKFSLSLS